MIDDNKKEPIDCQFNEKTAAAAIPGNYSNPLVSAIVYNSFEILLRIPLEIVNLAQKSADEKNHWPVRFSVNLLVAYA